jgi:hypothetical protein
MDMQNLAPHLVSLSGPDLMYFIEAAAKPSQSSPSANDFCHASGSCPFIYAKRMIRLLICHILNPTGRGMPDPIRRLMFLSLAAFWN